MKKHIAIISVTVLFTALSLSSFAQSAAENQSTQKKQEKMEAMKVAFISQQMSLTPEEAQAFWPVYNAYQTKVKELKKAHKGRKILENGDLSSLTDAEIERLLDDNFVYAQAMLNLRLQFHADMKKILNVRKIAAFYKAEEDFKKELLRKVREQQSDPQDGNE